MNQEVNLRTHLPHRNVANKLNKLNQQYGNQVIFSTSLAFIWVVDWVVENIPPTQKVLLGKKYIFYWPRPFIGLLFIVYLPRQLQKLLRNLEINAISRQLL